jgi:predicted lipid-binding transport protein (Tim44 family)
VVGIVIFAMVAAFLGMRLYAVLGKRTGHEQQPLTRPADELLRSALPKPAQDDSRDSAKPLADSPQTPGAEAGLRAISVADRRFSPAEFLDGAKSAYRMILEAYWAGKQDDFAPYVSQDVREAFSESIVERTGEGHVLDNRLVTIESAMITDASMASGVASITVKFIADIAAVTRDAEGKVIAGSLTDAVPTEDVWVFTRDVRAADPNWILTDTDEAA